MTRWTNEWFWNHRNGPVETPQGPCMVREATPSGKASASFPSYQLSFYLFTSRLSLWLHWKTLKCSLKPTCFQTPSKDLHLLPQESVRQHDQIFPCYYWSSNLNSTSLLFSVNSFITPRHTCTYTRTHTHMHMHETTVPTATSQRKFLEVVKEVLTFGRIESSKKFSNILTFTPRLISTN